MQTPAMRNKTEWLANTAELQGPYLGMHRADSIIKDLTNNRNNQHAEDKSNS